MGGSTAGPGFSPESFRYLRELASHNERDWFQANKGRYEEFVQAPSLAFVRSTGPLLEKVSRHLVADARPVGGSIMRIYRDIRFSKDKSPYRTSVGIHFMHDGGTSKEEHLPGFFLHLAPGDSWAYAGMWQAEGAQLERVRRSIVDRRADWKKVRDAIGEIEGEALKRPPPGFDPKDPYIGDIQHKGFTAGLQIPDADVIRDDFPRRFVGVCKTLDPLNRFLAKSIGLPY
ncbi:MAG TPA: DUF2461 domain-containing protein [Thermoplasmata archaeon]|nr:DUF2461 domain-containing protein [Thermoplasmata archaeon]